MIHPMTAARMIQADYAGKPIEGASIAVDLGSAEARIIRRGDDIVLLCRGSDEPVDWLRNFRFVANSWPDSGDSGIKYHRGFLKGAREIWAWIERTGWRHRITQVIGHSKGAAEAGIIASSLGVPAICFATPRALKSAHALPGAKGVLNILRRDDYVTKLPPWYGHVGVVQVLDAPWRWGESHRIGHYIDGIMAEAGMAA